MEIALVIKDGLEQFVLTPETDTEKMLVNLLTTGQRQVSIKRGSFYECRGGWYRQGTGDDSAIICLYPKQKDQDKDEDAETHS